MNGKKGAPITSLEGRTNIYVGPAIKARVVRYGDRINVSAICTAALAAECDRLEELDRQFAAAAASWLPEE